jgi:hypothetical protein
MQSQVRDNLVCYITQQPGLEDMKIKLFIKSFSHFRSLCLLGLGLLGTCGTVSATMYDYSYSVKRFQDMNTGYMVSEIANYYEADVFGNALYTKALPLYLGTNPDISNGIGLNPGFSIQVAHQPGGGLILGSVSAIQGDGGGGPGPGLLVNFISKDVNKLHGKLTIISAPPGTEITLPNGETELIKIGHEYPAGCYQFSNPVTWKGCDVALDYADGQFSSVYAIMGGGEYWPNSSVPSFFADKKWDLVYIGDSDTPFNGSGFGKAAVQCDTLEFMSVATPEVYIGCVPEPTTAVLLAVGGGVALFARRRQCS